MHLIKRNTRSFPVSFDSSDEDEREYSKDDYIFYSSFLNINSWKYVAKISAEIISYYYVK